MSVEHNRASARTTDPARVAAKAVRIEARLRRNPAHRLYWITMPTRDAEQFARAEAELEQERDRGI